jgi:hypothetical protein
LDLIPVAEAVSPAYGKQPTASQIGLASWGASIIKDPSKDLFHMFVSEMGLHCGLTSWYRNSVIVHATAPTADGPFVRKEQLLSYFAHEPVICPVPAAAGGGYLLYKIGCADGAVTGSNGTALAGPCVGCSNGTTAGQCPHPDQVYERACQDLLFAPTLDGPWTRHNLSLPGWDWANLNLGMESHAPLLLENGTVLSFTRSWLPPKPLPSSPVWLVRAERGWNGAYEAVHPDAPVFADGMEDSYLWVDPRGHFHALFHAFDATYSGGHAYSRDGLDWAYSPTPAYSTTVETSPAGGGGSVHYVRRERPHLVLDGGQPTHLVTGVTHPPGDWSFTHVQRIAH